jgi:hypothetical protein
VLDTPPYSTDLAPGDYFFFTKVKSQSKRLNIVSISDIHKALKVILHTTAKDDFYKGIQNPYGRAILCEELEGMYIEN